VPSENCTVRAFTSTFVASASSTSVFFEPRRMERIGEAISLGLRPAVATWYSMG
jgi:hypothetical protein